MASLRDQFEHFYAPDEDAEKTAIQTGLVTPDTNVLLNLYRFQARPRDELFGALEKLGERLWIPHQVGLEFHRRRLDVIAEQEKYFDHTRKDLDALVGNLRKRVETFRTRIALDEARIGAIKEGISSLQKLLTAEVIEARKANEVRLKDRDSDAVLARLESLLDSRVGEPMRPKVLKAARKEAKRRVANQLPPGYRDSRKADPTGDYLIFRQLMDKAKERRLPVLFITDDEKSDWYRCEHDIPLGPRYELREEMMAEAGVPFVIMTTQSFLQYAKEYLNAEVSAETVDQAKELPGIVEDDLRTEFERELIARRDVRERAEENIQSGRFRRDLDEIRFLEERLALIGKLTPVEAIEAADRWRRLLKYRELARDVPFSPEEDEQE